jgi:hypothetical protein
MTRVVVGDDRSQSTLFPERLDDYLSEDNPVRAVDVFVDELDLAGLGFGGVEPEATGRPAYHPATLLTTFNMPDRTVGSSIPSFVASSRLAALKIACGSASRVSRRKQVGQTRREHSLKSRDVAHSATDPAPHSKAMPELLHLT